MQDQESLKRIEERLTRLEATLARQPVAPQQNIPGGAVVDPAPWGGGGGWSITPPRWNPVVDPAPWGGGGGWSITPPRWNPVVDPAPWGGGGGWSIVPPRWNPVVDPAPWGGGGYGGGTVRPPIGTIADPPPPDFSKLDTAQLEATLHNINAEKARLESLEKLVQRQMDQLKK